MMSSMRSRGIVAVLALSVGVVTLLGFNLPAASWAVVSRGCVSDVSTGVLPRWARAGFSGSQPRMPYELGRNGRIAALVFGYPLLSPPGKDQTNKILWVERHASQRPTALWIHAQRMSGTHAVGPAVTRVVGHGPGPSIINLPAAGCWRLTLTWSGRSDTLDLRYLRGR
jgi:hypothetical protein